MRLYKRCGCGKGQALAERKRLWRRCEHDYSFSFKLHGEKRFGHTGTRDPEAAATEARRKRVEIEQSAGPGRGAGGSGIALDFLEALDMKRVKDEGCRPERATDIEQVWSKLFIHLGGPHRDVMSLTNADVGGYEGARRNDPGHGRGVRGQTIRKELYALKRGYRLAVRDGEIQFCPIAWELFDPIESDDPDEKQASKQWTEAEIRKVVAHLSAKALRAGILDLITFAAETGLRLEELKRYDRDAWLRAKVLHVPASGAKTGAKGARVIHLRRRALAIAKKWRRFNVRKPHKALKLACEKAGFSKVLTPRDLRAHRITEWAKQSPIAAQRLAGHTNLATTSRYLHPEAELMRRVALAGETRRGDTRRRRRNKSMKTKGARSSVG